MSNDNEPEVKDVERVEVVPAGDDEETVDSPESSKENETEEGEEKKEEKPESEETEDEESEESKPEGIKPVTDDVKIKTVEGETPREYALRQELAKAKDEIRKGRVKEIFIQPPAPAKKELSPERKKILEKYKPEDINTLKEVFDVMAEDLGFVKKDELGVNTFQKDAAEILDSFIEKHPEYQPQNDPDKVLWNRFNEVFSQFRQPKTMKELKQFLEKTHKEVYDIKPVADLTKQDAAKEKIKVASHSGTSKPSPTKEGVRRGGYTAEGLRTDMLKGFTDEELSELAGE